MLEGKSKLQRVTEMYQIEDSPWTDTKTQGVNFNDYKARIKA